MLSSEFDRCKLTRRSYGKKTMDQLLNFNIDTYIAPFLPPNQLHRLPQPLAHFLGHRTRPHREPVNLVQWTLAFTATVAGLCTVGAVYNCAPGVTKYDPPVLVTSLGASAVLDYNTVQSPLAQPRNTIVGHTLSALLAVCVAKLFQLRPDSANLWVVAALACACANLGMSITGSVHPPGGATAIVACIDPNVIRMGWMFPVLMLLASVLICAVACLFNNTLRQYPTHWWTSGETGQRWGGLRDKCETKAGLERGQGRDDDPAHGPSKLALSPVTSLSNAGTEPGMIVGLNGIHLPHGLMLTQDERAVVELLQTRIRDLR